MSRRRAWSRSPSSCSWSGFPIAARRSAARPMRSARPRARPICRACRSARPNSSPTCCRDWRPLGGLFLTFVTYSGEASAANGDTYTLFSIAAVVLGGVSLFGGSGSAIGAIFGALMFRTIGDLLFVFNLDPLWQPLFPGPGAARGGLRRLGEGVPGPQSARAFPMSENAQAGVCGRAHAADRSAGRDRLRLHRRDAAFWARSIPAAFCRPNIFCSN